MSIHLRFAGWILLCVPVAMTPRTSAAGFDMVRTEDVSVVTGSAESFDAVTAAGVRAVTESATDIGAFRADGVRAVTESAAGIDAVRANGVRTVTGCAACLNEIRVYRLRAARGCGVSNSQFLAAPIVQTVRIDYVEANSLPARTITSTARASASTARAIASPARTSASAARAIAPPARASELRVFALYGLREFSTFSPGGVGVRVAGETTMGGKPFDRHADDPWLGFDKAQHLSFSFLWTLGTQYVAVNKGHLSESQALPLSIGTSALIGITKEYYDLVSGPPNVFSYKDLVANGVGILLATGLILL